MFTDIADIPPTSELYNAAVNSFMAFARELSDADWLTRTPCLPGWDVRDVLSHVSGIPDDAIAGRMDGAPGEEWTASQVERNREYSVEELLARWAEQYVGFGEILVAIGEDRPPFDCHAHEHDIRHALGRPGNRDSLVVAAASAGLATDFELPFPVCVELSDGRTFGAPGPDGVTLRNVSAFEIFRSRLGRRAIEQVRAYDWTGDPERVAALIDVWFEFGPAMQPIEE